VNPVRQVHLFKENNQRVRYLSQEEMRSLLDNAPEPLKSIIIIALHTGMRQGEIVNLKWHDINLELKTVYLEDTKSGEKRIPINEIVCNLLWTLKLNNEIKEVTPSPISTDEPNMLKSVRVNQDNVLAIISRDGGTADAKDLKSFEE